METRLQGGHVVPRHRGRLGSIAWRVYLAAGALALGGYFLLPSLEAQALFYFAVSLLSVVVVPVALRIHRPSRRLPWYLLAAGLFMSLAGDSAYAFVLEAPEKVVTVADVFYLLAYPLSIASLFVFMRDRSPGRDRPGLIDATIVATGAGVRMPTP